MLDLSPSAVTGPLITLQECKRYDNPEDVSSMAH